MSSSFCKENRFRSVKKTDYFSNNFVSGMTKFTFYLFIPSMMDHHAFDVRKYFLIEFFLSYSRFLHLQLLVVKSGSFMTK